MCDYIIAEQNEINIKESTKQGKIKNLAWLIRFLNNKNLQDINDPDVPDLKHCIQQSDDMVKSVQQFIDKGNPEIKEPEGIFENIYNPTKAQDYLIRLLNEARKEVQLVLLPIGVGYITKKIEVYNILLEKAKQSGLNIRVLLLYDKATEASISKLNYDSKYTIKIQYIRKWNKPNQIVLMVDNKLVLNLTLTKIDSGEDIKYAIYSSEESVVLCYTTIIEYQSLISDI